MARTSGAEHPVVVHRVHPSYDVDMFVDVLASDLLDAGLMGVPSLHLRVERCDP